VLVPLALSFLPKVIKVVHDDGSGWAFGHDVSQPDVQGYFPMNYTRPRAKSSRLAKDRRDINGVVSNWVVPKSQICKLVAKPAPEIFRIQGTYHNEKHKHLITVALEG